MSATASVTPPAADPSLGQAARTRPVREVMRHGVVLCDADAPARDVARTMRDRGVQSVLAIDISSELIGLVDERSLARAWVDPDGTTAIAIADPDPLTVDPEESVGEVARKMLAAGVTRALVAAPVPSEESGVWSEWKERGLPLGMISVGDILARLDELEAVVRARPARRVSMGRRVAPWIAAAMVILIVILVAVVIYAYLQGTHQYTTKPGLQ
jgi:CBS domain-containing protein